MLHVMSSRCVARDLHTVAQWPLERTYWRQFTGLRGDCKKSRFAPFDVIILLLLSIFLSFFLSFFLYQILERGPLVLNKVPVQGIQSRTTSNIQPEAPNECIHHPGSDRAKCGFHVHPTLDDLEGRTLRSITFQPPSN